MLNDRFAAWVLRDSAEDFGKLRLSREQLVKAKEVEAKDDGDSATDAAPPAAATPSDSPAPAKDESTEKPTAPAAAATASLRPSSPPPRRLPMKPAADKPADGEAKPAATETRSEAWPATLRLLQRNLRTRSRHRVTARAAFPVQAVQPDTLSPVRSA